MEHTPQPQRVAGIETLSHVLSSGAVSDSRLYLGAVVMLAALVLRLFG